MNYQQKDLVRIAKRENNTKRSYLVVDPLQGKHVPVEPSKALNLFKSLAEKLQGKYEGERLLLIGFAETATAIGAQAAITLGTKYIQTTREVIPDARYLFFSEAHSHATEQKLVKDDIDRVINDIDRIVFIEDEVTTGNTIMNIIKIITKEYQKKIKLEFLPGDEHKIISDVMLLGRAFSNVTSNCIRYAKEMVWISVEENGEQLKITIRDDGPGILEDDLPHLFDRFYKGKNGNHGLGLSIAKRSMEYMGGDIAAKASPEGAIFTIILPQDCRSFAVEEWTEV